MTISVRGRRQVLLARLRIAGWTVAYLAALTGGCRLLEAQAPPPKPLTVCDLFGDLLSNSGRMLKVHGELIPYHGGWMLSPGQRCSRQFIVGETKWPTLLALEDAGASSLDTPSTFQPDKAAMKRLNDLVASLRRGKPYYVDPTGVKITATFTGELRTRKIVTEMLGTVPYKLHYGPGYGPVLGPDGIRCPAQLVIKTVEDIVVSPK